MPIRILAALALGMLALLIVPALAVADSIPAPDRSLPFSGDELAVLLIGAIVPLATYVINHNSAFIRSEQVKALIHVGAAALAGALYKLLETGELGLNASTLNLVVLSVVAALAAHAGLYRPSGISTSLGAGSNAR